jgi:hypothetical protein
VLILLVAKGLTVSLLTWCVGQRITAWRWRGERDMTVAIALMLVAILILVPPLSVIVGNAVHDLTGQWNLEAFVAHVLCIGADAAIVHHVAWRVLDRAELGRAFHTHVELPATLAVGLMFAFLELGNGVRIRRRCFYLVPTDIWLTLYWLVFCAVLAYMLLYSARAMLAVRRNPRSRTVATIYLCATTCGIEALLARAVEAVFPALNNDVGLLVAAIWGCEAVIAFAAGAGYSWRQKRRWFTERPDLEPSR